MQWTLNRLLPEFDELEESRVVGRQVVVLPDEDVEDAPIVRQPVEEFGRGKAVAPEHERSWELVSHAGLLVTRDSEVDW